MKGDVSIKTNPFYREWSPHLG